MQQFRILFSNINKWIFMNHSVEIMQIDNDTSRRILLKKYGKNLGISVFHLNDIGMTTEDEDVLLDKVQKIEHHTANLRATWFAGMVASFGIAWGIYYTFFIQPPKYILDLKQLSLSKEVYSNNADLKLHFVVTNQSSSAGEISKPILEVSSQSLHKSYEILPYTLIFQINSAGETDYDTGRTMRIGEYGRIDEYIIYRVGQVSNIENSEGMLQLLNSKSNDLEYKVRSYPGIEHKIQDIKNERLNI